MVLVDGRMYPTMCSECEKKLKKQLHQKGIMDKLVRKKKITKRQARI